MKGKIHIGIAIPGHKTDEMRRAKKFQHRQVRMRMATVRRWINQNHPVRAKQHSPRPHVPMSASERYIKFRRISMLDDAFARLFHLLQNLRGKLSPAREVQYPLLSIKMRPPVRRRA